MKREELYYYFMLSKTVSLWGRLVCNHIMKNDTQYEVREKMRNLGRMRKNYKSRDLRVDANLQLYDLSKPSLVGLIKWLLVPNVLTLFATSVCTAILYLPLHLITIQPTSAKTSLETTESFVVTEQFIEESLKAVQQETTPTIGPPPPPRDLRIIQHR